MNNINSELTRLIENQKDNFPLEQKFLLINKFLRKTLNIYFLINGYLLVTSLEFPIKVISS